MNQRNMSWQRHTVVTLLGWAVAFVIVYTMLLLFGEWLESIPPALNALVFTGIMVPLMGNLVMPYISRLLSK